MKTAFTALVAVLIMQSGVYAQQKQVRAEFEKVVPAEFQKGFCSTLENTIEAQKQQNWATLYALTLPGDRDGKTLKQFVDSAGGRPYSLREFKLTRIDAMVAPTGKPPNATWIVVGCAETQQGQERRTADAETDVYLENGKWYSLSVGLLLAMDDPNPSSTCDPKKALDVSSLCPQ